MKIVNKGVTTAHEQRMKILELAKEDKCQRRTTLHILSIEKIFAALFDLRSERIFFADMFLENRKRAIEKSPIPHRIKTRLYLYLKTKYRQYLGSF